LKRVAELLGVALLFSAVSPFLLVGPAMAASCDGVRIRAGESIQRAVDRHNVGTTFCLAPGTYNVRSSIFPKDGDRFVGTARHRRGVLVRTRSAEIIFELGGARRVTFRHFSIKGAVNRCPGQNCGETGRAISGGRRVTVRRMHLYKNGLNGIGGTSGPLVIKHSEIDHNGARSNDGVSGGIKSTDSLSVFGSFIHDNRGNGVWCDIQCGDFTVTGSRIKRNSASGILDEISQGAALFRGNHIVGNDTVGDSFRGGVSITNSKNVLAYNNVFRRNRGFGIGARMDERVNCGVPDSDCGYVISNVRIRANVLHGNSIVGCGLPGATCSKNLR
jgi:Right handed beta helix region